MSEPLSTHRCSDCGHIAENHSADPKSSCCKRGCRKPPSEVHASGAPVEVETFPVAPFAFGGPR
jgi:hypothetical protein